MIRCESRDRRRPPRRPSPADPREPSPAVPALRRLSVAPLRSFALSHPRAVARSLAAGITVAGLAVAGAVGVSALSSSGDTAGTALPLSMPAALLSTGEEAPVRPTAAGAWAAAAMATDRGGLAGPSTGASGGAATGWQGWVDFGNAAHILTAPHAETPSSATRVAADPRLAAVPPVAGTLGWLAAAPASPTAFGTDDIATAAVLGIVETLRQRPARHGPEDRVVQVGSGDTLTSLLVRAGVARSEAQAAIAALQGVFDPRRLQVGQEITLSFHHRGRTADFQGLSLMPDVETVAAVTREDDGAFAVAEQPVALVTRRVAASGVIQSSLAGDAADAGVPYQVLHRLVRAYSYDIDFQRDVQPGDEFALLFEQDFTEHGSFARHGAVIYAALTVSGETTPIIRFETPDGAVDYYHRDGLSVRKALLRTPVDGLRMSSGFGMRRHPILGYSRMHRGVDFAGPTGTPILAAGDGVVEVIGSNRGYGNYIRLRHNGRLQTAYAHMSRFARGLSRGSRVEQGQVIGYIGSTGLSTGPHLHYEVLVNGSQVNPLTIDMPTGRQLAGAELAAFQALTAELEAELTQEIAQQGQVAEAPPVVPASH